MGNRLAQKSDSVYEVCPRGSPRQSWQSTMPTLFEGMKCTHYSQSFIPLVTFLQESTPSFPWRVGNMVPPIQQALNWGIARQTLRSWNVLFFSILSVGLKRMLKLQIWVQAPHPQGKVKFAFFSLVFLKILLFYS